MTINQLYTRMSQWDMDTIVYLFKPNESNAYYLDDVSAATITAHTIEEIHSAGYGQSEVNFFSIISYNRDEDTIALSILLE